MKIAVSVLTVGSILLGAIGSDATLSGEPSPSKDARLVINWDTCNMWNEVLYLAQQERKLGATEVKATLEHIVDEHAKAKVDMIVHCIFVLPWGTVPPGFQSFYRLKDPGYSTLFHPGGETGLRELEEAGYDVIQVLLDRSHKQGLAFLGGMRMNDLHGGSAGTPFVKAHPEWMAKSPDFWLDYKHEGVRNAVLAVAAEFLERYDVDGLELDYMRFCYMFSRSELVQNAPILTGFTAQMRKLLDQAARKRGRDKLLLGVRVPPTIEECRLLGFDIKAWVHQGLVDFICPTDFAYTDYETKTEEFTALTRGTPCNVYPAVHPQYADYTLRPTITNEYATLVTFAGHRAAAKNFYAFGADGVSAYNYQDHWIVKKHTDEWPRTLSYLTGLRDPAALERGDRHYMFFPRHPHFPGVVQKRERILLKRRAGSPVPTFPDPTGSLPFRMAEDLTDPNLSATLEFKVTGMVEGDEFEVALNGQVIPADRFERKLADERQPLFYLYRTPLTSPPAKFGDNELRLRLTKSVGTATLQAQEIGVIVRDNALAGDTRNERPKQQARDANEEAAVVERVGAASSIPAVKAVVLINPNKGFGDWRPMKVLKMNGDTVARELPAEHQLICDGTTPKTPEFDLLDWPSLVYMPEKDRVLLVVNRETRDGVVLSSNDHGRTWSKPKYMHTDDQGRPDARGLPLTYLGDGNLILGEWFSHDYGETWGDRTTTPPASTGGPFYLWDPYLVDRDPETGKVTRLIAPGYTPAIAGHDFVLSLVRFSYDGGLTWPVEIAPPSWNGKPSGTSTRETSEKALCRARNGTIIAACRAGDRKYTGIDHYRGLGISLSKDDGRTWTELNVLFDYGRHHASMVLMPNGNIVMTYVVRFGWLGEKEKVLDEDGYPQWGVEAIVSRDNGESWDLQHRYVLAKWSGQSHVQRTSTILLPDGSLLTAFGAGYRIRRMKDPDPWLGPQDVGLVRWRPVPD